MIVGAVAFVATMAWHPSGRELVAAADAAAVASRAKMVHGLGIASLVVAFFGLLGLWRRLRTTAPALADFGLVCHACGSGAAVVAAIASGFVSVRLLLDQREAEGAAKAVLDSAVHGSAYLNQGCALVYVLASGAAIVAWSLAGVRHRTLPRWLAGYGLVTAFAAAALTAAGHVRMDVHGFGAVVLGQAIWLVGGGAVLCAGARNSAIQPAH